MTTEEQLKAIADKYGVNAQKPIQSGGLDSLRQKLNQTTQQPQQTDNAGGIKQIVSEPARTLITQPGIRAGQAIGSLGLTLANKLSGGKLSESVKERTGQTLDERMNQSVGQDISTVNGTVLSKGVDGSGRQIVGETLQSASYLIPYGKVAGALGGGTVGNVIAGAAGGYTADAGYGLTDKNKTVGEALTPGVGTALGAAIPGALPLLTGAGRVTSKVGSKMVESVIPTSSREAGILQTYKANKPFLQRIGDVLSGTEKAPITAGKTALTTTQGQTVNGLFGTKSQIGVQAKRASDSLWSDVIAPRLKESTKAVDLDQFFNKIEGDIIANNPELSRQKSLLEGLQSIREDYAGTKVISLDKLQKLKEGWAQFVPEKAYNGKPIAGAFNDVRNIMSGEARQTIYNELGDDVKQAYIDYGNLTGLKEMGKKSMTGQALKGGTGGLISEIFSQAVTPVGTVGGQVLYRIGNGLEFLGNAGAKKLSQVLGVADNVTQEANIPMKAQSTTTPKMIKNSSISQVSKKNGIMSSDLSTGVKKAFNDAKDTLKTLKDKNVRERGSISLESILPESKSVGSRGVSLAKNTTEDLVQQAKKYKSAEEFVKSQPTVYRGEGGSNVAQGKALLAEGKHYASDAEYPKGFGKVEEYVLKPKAKVLDLGDSTFAEISQKLGIPERNYISPKELASIAKEKGYDVVKYTGEYKSTGKQFIHTVDLTGDSYITKSQLTDIWNKANKK